MFQGSNFRGPQKTEVLAAYILIDRRMAILTDCGNSHVVQMVGIGTHTQFLGHTST